MTAKRNPPAKASNTNKGVEAVPTFCKRRPYKKTEVLVLSGAGRLRKLLDLFLDPFVVKEFLTIYRSPAIKSVGFHVIRVRCPRSLAPFTENPSYGHFTSPLSHPP